MQMYNDIKITKRPMNQSERKEQKAKKKAKESKLSEVEKNRVAIHMLPWYAEQHTRDQELIADYRKQLKTLDERATRLLESANHHQDVASAYTRMYFSESDRTTRLLRLIRQEAERMKNNGDVMGGLCLEMDVQEILEQGSIIDLTVEHTILEVAIEE